MAGTITGGLKARDKILALDPDFYKRIGSIGGKQSSIGGFNSNKIGKDGLTGPQRASVVGKIGGTVSRRKGKQ